MYRIVIIIIGLFSVALQHVVHEFSHAVAAHLLGEKVVRIQWLTYQGGTRVFFENEPDFTCNPAKKWGIIAASGYFVTNTIGYILTAVYYFSNSILVKRVTCIPAIMFLTIDCIYFVLGSFGNFGDITGIRKTFHIPRWLTNILTVLMLAFNLWIVISIFY